MNFILIAVMVLGAIGLIAAVVLFAASKKFAVYEDPRIAQVGEVLPGANCGGCGFPGCSGMADALVKGADAGSLDGLFCPVGGADTNVMVLASIVLALPSMPDFARVLLCMPVVLVKRPVASAVWVVVIASRLVSSTPSISIPRLVSPRSMRRSVRLAAVASRLVRVALSNCARRVRRVGECLSPASIRTRVLWR